ELGAPDQLPAARKFAWIDAGLRAADRDRAGGYANARLGAARDVQGRIETEQVGEPGREAEHRDPVIACRMACDELVGSEAGVLRGGGEIGAVRAAVADFDIDPARAVRG